MKTLAPRGAILALAAAVAVTAGWPRTARAQPVLRSSVFARAVQPGEVIRLDVTCTCDTATATATAFGSRVAFVPGRDTATWQALIGIDLDTKPGTYPVRIAMERPGERSLTTMRELRVASRQFPTRRLRVDNRFVDPPQEAIARILLEAERLRALFDTVSPEPWNGALIPPVTQSATPNFGARSIFNGQARSPHAGVDFGSAPGTPVLAPGAGTVVLAEDLFFTGNTVIIDHGLGLYSMLAHLSTLAVAAGDRLGPGHVVGSVGATGRVTGPHLHWSVRLNAARVDPLSLLAAVEAQ